MGAGGRRCPGGWARGRPCRNRGSRARPALREAGRAVRGRGALPAAVPEVPLPHPHQLRLPQAGRRLQGRVSAGGRGRGTRGAALGCELRGRARLAAAAVAPPGFIPAGLLRETRPKACRAPASPSFPLPGRERGPGVTPTMPRNRILSICHALSAISKACPLPFFINPQK